MAKKEEVKKEDVKKETVIEYATNGLEVKINHKPEVEVKK